jgi:hypothetical protein
MLALLPPEAFFVIFHTSVAVILYSENKSDYILLLTSYVCMLLNPYPIETELYSLRAGHENSCSEGV